MIMPYTIEDYRRDVAEEYFEAHQQDFVQRLSPDDRLRDLSSEEILQHLDPQDIGAYLQKIRRGNN